MGNIGLSTGLAFVSVFVASVTIATAGLCPVFFCSSSMSNSEEKLSMVKGPIKIFSNSHHGQTLEIRPGETFVIILPNPGSGGYVVQDPEFDSQILTLQKMDKKPPSKTNREGDFGSLEWTFQAEREGVSMLIIRASRPWEKDKTPKVIFEASIEVRQ